MCLISVAGKWMIKFVIFDQYLSANDSSEVSLHPAFWPGADGHVLGYRAREAQAPKKHRFVVDKTSKEVRLYNRQYEQSAADWNLVLLALMIVFVVMSKTLFPRRFKQLQGALFGTNYLNQLLREWNPVRSFMGFFFILAYVLIFGLFLQRLLIYFSGGGDEISSPLSLFYLSAGVAAFLLLRMLMVNFFAFLFRTQEVSIRYLTTQLSYFVVTTMMLLPMMFVFTYNPIESGFYIGVGLVAALLIYRFYRSLIVGATNSRFSVLYLFLYLCALEIVPFLLLVKLVLLFVSGEL